MSWRFPFCERRRAAHAAAAGRTRLILETLEDRTLLSVKSPLGMLDAPTLAVDPKSYHPASILVRFRDDAFAAGTAALPVTGTTIGSELPLVPGLREVWLGSGMTVEAALAAYSGNPLVLYAQPNYRVQLLGHSGNPDDPQFHSLWGMNNTGQTGGTPDADIDALEAWTATTGSRGTIVAVIDTGVDYTHPDLAANIWTNTDEIPGNNFDDDRNGYKDDIHGYDFVNNDGNPMDDNSHGTHVAGTIGAVGDNGVGVAGVNWNVQIMALKFLDAGGSGYTSAAIKALDYAVANGAVASNNSWGCYCGFEQSLYDAIGRARQAGHIFVAAAGNSSGNNDSSAFYPASYDLDNVVSVAATDHKDRLADFSNYGADTVDLGAPGVDILSTTPGNSYSSYSGTSMATPHVTGVIALIRDQHPTWDYIQVIDQLLATTDAITALDGKTATGGRLNAAAAVGNPAPDTTGPRITANTPNGGVTGTVSLVQITFNEPIDPATFTTDDITNFTGPNGPLPATGLSAVTGSNNRKFDITFDPQTTLGDYSLTIGPDIADPAGNRMDQNRNGTSGELPDDQFTALFSITEVIVFSSTDVPAPIIDFVETVSYLDVTQDVTIGDLNVQVNITHTYTGDLRLSLYSPLGFFVRLAEFRGGAGEDYDDTIFDDEAATPIGNGFAPFTGSYRPEMPLSEYDGFTTFGMWELHIEDLAYLDTGTLNSWSLIVQPGDGTPPPPPGNLRPDAVDDYAETDEDTAVTIPVLANDSDPLGDLLMVVSVNLVTNGTAVINADNTITFTPNPDSTAPGTFAYVISDPEGATDGATVIVNVRAVNDAPVAVDDHAVAAKDTPLTFNGSGGNPPRLEANDIDVDGDVLSITSVGSAVHGTAVLNGNGTVTFTPETGYLGSASFEYTVSDGTVSDVAAVQLEIKAVYYLSTTTSESLTNSDGSVLSFSDADILLLTVDGSGAYEYRMFFDGSDVGLSLAGEGIDAFTFLSDGSIIVSPVGAFSVPKPSGGSYSGSGEDLIKFVPTSLGENTAGSWSFYFDGSDVGLSGTAENVDAVGVLSNGRVVISTAGTFSVPKGSSSTLAGGGEDLLQFKPDSLGSSTKGSWSFYIDGSDVGLSGTNENIDALYIKPSPSGGNPKLYVSTSGDFSVPVGAGSLGGADEDVFVFSPATVGSSTTGSYDSTLAFDGGLYGLDSFDIDGIHLGRAPNQSLAGPLGGAWSGPSSTSSLGGGTAPRIVPPAAEGDGGLPLVPGIFRMLVAPMAAAAPGLVLRVPTSAIGSMPFVPTTSPRSVDITSLDWLLAAGDASQTSPLSLDWGVLADELAGILV